MAIFDKRKGNEPAAPAEAAAPPPPAASQPAAPQPVAPPPRMTHGVSEARDIAIIGRSITVQGEVSGAESLVIEGQVHGTVTLNDHDLTVGQLGVVTASVMARVVRIEGQVTGDIHGSEKVAITRTGRVQGNIVAPRVSLEDGARFKGRIDMDPAMTPAAAAPQPLKSVT